MNIPECVRIGSMVYEVILTDKTIISEGRQCYGHINFNNHLIEIDKNLRDIQGQEQTLLHEIVHGILDERSIDVNNCSEEMLVDELAKGLHQLILDNPLLFLNSDIEFEEQEEEDVSLC